MPPPYNQVPDLTHYIAVGDSITAGYADGALYYKGQLHAYANIVAGQIRLITGTKFTQPLMPSNSVGVDLTGNSRLALRRKVDDPNVFLLGHLSPQGDLAALHENAYATQGPFTNMGVPGAKVITTVLPGFGNSGNGAGYYNPFFTRMASNVETASILSDAAALHASFFSLFIGNNDALAYALAGCTENAMSPCTGSAGSGFDGSLMEIVNTLTKHGAKGVIANLPSIANIPYFNTIPYNGLLLTAEEATSLNQDYRSEGIQFHEGKNNFMISTSSMRTERRLAQKGELILMDVLLDPKSTIYLKGKEPIPKKYNLSPSEALSIEERISEYNLVIQNLAKEKELGFVNVNHLVKSARADREYNPHTLSLDYAKKGVFSLDGLHPNAFGQALLANEFIKAINMTYGTEIQPVRSHQYEGIVFP